MSIIIGLTGGIGSGKSTVAKIFAQLGVPVLDADAIAKTLMNQDPSIKVQLIHLLEKRHIKTINSIGLILLKWFLKMPLS